MPQPLRHQPGPGRGGYDASRRSGHAVGFARQRRARWQGLYRPSERAPRQHGRSASGPVRRPRADPAMGGPGSAGPLRHHGLRALHSAESVAQAADAAEAGIRDKAGEVTTTAAPSLPGITLVSMMAFSDGKLTYGFPLPLIMDVAGS